MSGRRGQRSRAAAMLWVRRGFEVSRHRGSGGRCSASAAMLLVWKGFGCPHFRGSETYRGKLLQERISRHAAGEEGLCVSATQENKQADQRLSDILIACHAQPACIMVLVCRR